MGENKRGMSSAIVVILLAVFLLRSLALHDYKQELATQDDIFKDRLEVSYEDMALDALQAESTNIVWQRLIDDDVIDACNARNYIGEEKIVEGRIADVFHSFKYGSKTSTVFLNFEKPYPNQCFTAVIFSSDSNSFPESSENDYEGKTIRIKGDIKEYMGRPQIILRSISQIEVGG